MKYPMKLNLEISKSFVALMLTSLVFLATGFRVVDKGQVIINIEGLKSDKGELILAVFNNKDSYLKEDFIHKKVKVDNRGKTIVTFDDLPVGEYAVSVIHDENQNGKLDKNMVGIPKESFGFSNVSLGLFGPPSYDNTKFTLAGEKVEVTVKLKTLM